MSTYLLNSTTTPALVSGQVVGIGVRRDAGTVIFHNVSVNTDILLSLGVVNPGPTTTPGGEWPYVCPAGHSLRIQIPEANKTASAVAPYWQGKIWVLPINQSGQQAPTGQQPPIGNLWIMTFADGEPVVDMAPSTQATTQIGQQRVVSVPAASLGFPFLLTSLAAPSDHDLAGYTPSATIVAQLAVYVYLYYFSLLLTVQSGVVGMDFQLWVDIRVGGSTVSSTLLLEGMSYSGANTSGTLSPYVFASSTPYNTGKITWVGVATNITFRLHVTSVTAGSINAKIALIASPDEANSVGLGPIGNFPVNTGIF